MNSNRKGKPFSKGNPAKKSDSRSSDKKSFKGKTDFSGPSRSFSKKTNPKDRFKDSDKKRGGASSNGKTFSKDKSSSSGKFSDRAVRGEKKSFREDREKRPSFSGDKKFKPRNEGDSFKPDRKKSFTKDKPFSKGTTKGKSFNENSSFKSDKKSFSKDRPFSKEKSFKDKGDKKPRFKDSSFRKEVKQPNYSIEPPKGAAKVEKKGDGKIRLNKYIANSGICSRRDADQLISLGEVTVNGQIITELGYKVALSDQVTLNGRSISPEKLVYVILNKPKDFITTTDDPQERKTVMSLVSNACKERIVPVGRLDRNTTGLLLFTNDGDLAEKLTHPRKKVKKVYQADLDKPITKDDFEKIANGLRLEDGPVKVDALALVSADKKSVGIEIHEGRNRIVRRIFESLGYDVIRLDRVMYAGLTKKDLPRGHWRYLTEKEVIHLKYML